MRSNHRQDRMTAAIAVIVAAIGLTTAIAPTATAGPIGEMIARHRQARQMRLPAVDKPRAIKPYKDPNARTAGLSQRFKQRFSLKKDASQDQGVIKTSR